MLIHYLKKITVTFFKFKKEDQTLFFLTDLEFFIPFFPFIFALYQTQQQCDLTIAFKCYEKFYFAFPGDLVMWIVQVV